MPEYILHRAFTSQIIINRVKQKENLVIDNVRDALKHAVENGVKTLIIQPTHMMKGLNTRIWLKKHRSTGHYLNTWLWESRF